MKGIAVFLLLLGVVFGVAPVCPSHLEVSREMGSCYDVCDAVLGKEQDSFNRKMAVGYMPTKSSPGLCSCYWAEEEDGQVIRSLYCEYVVSLASQSPLSIDLDLRWEGSKVPETLIRVASFDGNVEVPETIATTGMDSLFRGLYTAYSVAIMGISAILSALFLVLAFGWQVASSGYGTVFHALRTKGEFWGPLKVEYVQRSVPVFLALLFFGFPVSVESPVHKSAGVGVKEELYSPDSCDVYETYARRVEAYDLDLPAEEGSSGGLDWGLLEEIARAVGIEGELLERLREVLERILRKERDRFEDEKEALVFVLEEMASECRARAAEEGESFVPSSPEKIYLPVAVAVAKGFINYGVEKAQKVADYVNERIKAYVVGKISENAIALERGASVQKVRYEKALREIEAYLQSGIVQTGGMWNCPVRSCEELSSLSSYEEANLRAEYPDCDAVFRHLRNVCSKIAQLKRRVREEEEEWKRTSERLLRNIELALEGSEEALGFLAPAVSPLASVYALYSSVRDLDSPSYVLTKTEEAYRGSFLGQFFHGVKSFTAWVGEKVGGAVETVKGVSSVVASTSSPSMDKGLSFFLGQVVVITAVPPGSMIEDSLRTLGEIALKPLTFMTSKVAFLGVGDLFSSIAGAIGSMGGAILVKILAYNLTLLIFKVLPFLAVSFAVFLRFIAYLVEIFRFMLTIPTYVIFTATKNPGAVWDFAKELGRLMVMPILLAFTPLVAFFGVELVYAFFFWLPMTLVAHFLPDSFFSYFLAGAVSASLFVFATFMATVIGWNVAYSFAEGVLEHVSSLFGRTATSVSQRVEAVRGTISRAVGVQL